MISPLEPRILLTDLFISGTSRNDSIAIVQTNVSKTSATLKVSNNGFTTCAVKINGVLTALKKQTTQTIANISTISAVDLGKGDDNCSEDATVLVSTTVLGSDGIDTLTTGGGNDLIAADRASGAGFNDIIAGGAGNDTLFGYAGNDQINGNDGNDSVQGGSGNDTIRGEGGSDQLLGESGDDSIRGGTGNDTIDAGAGLDKIFGEEGNDVIPIFDGFKDTVSGGLGTDKVDDASYDGDVVSGIEAGSFVVYSSGDNQDGPNFQIQGTAGADKISASLDSSDVLNYTINGVTVHLNQDQRKAIIIKTNPDKRTPLPDRIFIVGLAGNDTITAGDGIEGISGNEGDDTITSTDPTPPHDSHTTVQASIDGDAGNDKIVVTGGLWKLYGDFQNSSDGTGGSDTITGGSGNDSIYGGDGNDVIAGAGGNDSLVGDDDENQNEPDFPGNDSIDGGSGNDFIDGSTGNDTLRGQAGKDSIFGQDGIDSLDGGDDNDTLDGGSGSDTMHGGAGGDNADYRERFADVFLSLDGVKNDGELGENDFIDVDVEVLTGGFGNDSLVGDGKDNILAGKDGNDTLIGNGGNDTLFTSNGNDEAHGGSGNDSLKGDPGNDILFGDDGNDTLDCGTGNDTADGGNNDDTFLNADGAFDSLLGGLGTDKAQTATGDGDSFNSIEVLT